MVLNGNILRNGLDSSISWGNLSRLSLPLNIEHMRIRLKTLSFLLLFFVLLPITWLITAVTLAIHWMRRRTPVVNPHAKRILISGGGMTKALQLVRSLYSAGHQIFLTEEYSYTAHRFSRCLTRFYLCANTKIHTPYIQSIIDIVRREKIDIFIPVSHSWCECADSIVKEALLPFNCETIQGDLSQLEMLSDKYRFINQARAFGLTVPKTYKITDPKQVLDFDFSKEKCQFILKSLFDNNLTRWDLIKLPCPTQEEMLDYLNSLTISEQYPWILQEFIPGKEYCTHGTVRDGELRLYTCCQSSSWLLRYKHLEEKPLIFHWVREFCSKANLSGQASFDFIESYEDGRPYALECNPRTHTAITAFYNHPGVAEGYLDKKPLSNGPILPYHNARQTYWLYHELWNLSKIRSLNDFYRQLNIFIHGKEAIYSVDDPWPFFFQYTFHMPCVLIDNLINPIPYKKVDCNLGMLL